MCGLAGVLGPRDARGAAEAADRRTTVGAMTETLRPRGPDASGLWGDDRCALGHRRLSILDLSDAGAQPMTLRPGGPVIAYNGEAYNFADLRRALVAEGRSFRGHSDTEVILNAYDAWGLDGLRRVEGIFAIALWDPARERLVLMRDRLGVKPLFHAAAGPGLAFGSEIKAVLAAGGVDTALDDQALSEYLWYGNAHEDRTPYAAVRSLQPGHWLVDEAGARRIEPWWRVEEWLGRPGPSSPRAAVEAIRAALDSAVERQLVADVPVALFLSGGIDSSAIAASAARAAREPLLSYAAAFDFERGVDERPKAQAVARHLGLRHHELRVAAADLPDVLLTLARAHDEPFADAANIPLYLLCRALGGGAKVVLQGDGGDELFAGYRRYAMLRNAWAWRRWPRRLSALARAAGGLGRRVARMADSVGHPDPALQMALLLTVETLDDPPEGALLPERRSHLAATTDPFRAYRRAAERFRGHDPVQRMLLTDLVVQLPSQFLPKVDRATMALGVEARVPLLDERVASLAVGLPARWKVRGLRTKVLLREAQRGRLPDAILDAPKTGFGVPFGHWLRGPLLPLARERLLDARFGAAFGLDRVQVERQLAAHASGARDHGFRLWKLLQLALWDEVRRA